MALHASDSSSTPRPGRSRRPAAGSVGQNISEVFERGSQLVADRLELLQFDVREGAKELARGALFWSLAGLFSLGALVGLSVALGLALRPVVGDALAALAVALVHAAATGLCVRAAKQPQAPSAQDVQALVAPSGTADPAAGGGSPGAGQGAARVLEGT